jgi:lysophospholipase L1-like esterase
VAAALSLPTRRLVALAGGALLTAGLLVVAGSASSPAVAAPGSGPTAVVALGDSAISGEGAGAYEPGTNGPGGDFCHRSTRALIQQTTIPGIQAKISLACSGAASSDVRINGTTHYTEPSQADRLRAVARDNDVKMIVLQIGANDDPHFADTVLSCVEAWANPFGPACSTALAAQWPARVAAMAPKVEASINDVRTVMRDAGYADSSYQFVLQSYASPFSENMNSVTHAFEGCPLRLADAKFSRTQAVGQLSAALRGAAQATGVRFLDLARASEGHEACNKSTSDHWITPLTVDVGTLLHSVDPSHIVQQSFHPNSAGHAQLGRCLTEFFGAGLTEGQCLRGADGNLHADAGITAPTARAVAAG